jgi:ATP-dependent Clp protease protease subunit
MPIGVPRVPHRLPGESTSQWLDIYNKLYRERTLFLGEEIDDELANQLVGIMLFLNTEDSTRRLFLYINSPGGSVLGGFAIFDAIHHVIAPTTTICFGVAASMASFILNGGEKGQRIALPHSRTMIHQPRCGLVGQAAEVQYEFEEADRLHDKIIEIYAKQTGQTPETIAEDLDRDFFMTATETKEYGLVDQVTVQMK